MDVAFARAFTSTPTFEATLAGVAVSPLSNCYIGLQGTIAFQGPIERVMLPFQSTLSEQDRSLFDDQLEHCKALGPPMIQ